jgi:hypothetical protein
VEEVVSDLSERTLMVVSKMFPEQQHEEVERILASERGNNLPSHATSDPTRLERVRFAVLKLSAGNLVTLRETIEDAKMDWRDTFMAAGFGYDVMEHERWADGFLTAQSRRDR